MKPSLTPCSFSKESLYFLRRSMTACMLTSLKVVRMAFSVWDWIRRSATRAGRRLMGTRCSGRPSRLTGTGAAGAADAAGACVAFRASPLVTRPPRPVPSTVAGSMPFSDRILPAAGEATEDLAAGLAASAAGTGAGAGAAAGAGAGAAALASVSMRARTSPEVTVLPSPLTISESTPETGAGTSSTTLSVSTSIRISSACTASPGCFFQLSRVASDTDSESCGTRTSVMAMMILPFCLYLREVGLLDQREALQLGRERLLDQCPLLFLVLGQVADRRRSRGRAAGVAELLAVAHVLVQVMLHVEPRPLVLRLVLHPDQFLGVGVFLQFGLEGLVGEGVELFDAQDGHVLAALLIACVDQIVVDLAGAHLHALHLGRDDVRAGFADHGLEGAGGQVFQGRSGVLVAQQRLGREQDQR